MINKAHAKFPRIHLVRADLLSEWPETLPTAFDRVVSAYVLHEFDMNDKVRLISRIAENYLGQNGRILIADIAFPSIVARNAAAEHWSEKWDETEYYWAADEAMRALENAGFKMEFQQVSSCAGIFQISNSNESADIRCSIHCKVRPK